MKLFTHKNENNHNLDLVTTLEDGRHNYAQTRLIVDFKDVDVSGFNFYQADLSQCSNLKLAKNIHQAIWREANLSGLDLSELELQGIVFADCQLRFANFYNSDLQGANFSNSDLRDTNFSWSDLKNANLSNSNLQGANLSWADLKGTNLNKADQKKANLDCARLSQVKKRFLDYSYKV